MFFSLDMLALHKTVRSMLKRRADVLVLESQASRQALQKNHILSDECVKRHMKHYRNDFDGSEAQKFLVAIDGKKGGLSKWQAGKTHGSLEFGPLVKKDIPPPRARFLSKRKKADRRAVYYGKMANQLREAGVSRASQEALKCRRVASIMKRRHEKFVAGQRCYYTTQKWPQHHLRAAGVSLPEVQWGEKGPREQQKLALLVCWP